MEIKISSQVQAPLNKVFNVYTDIEGSSVNLPGVEEVNILEGESPAQVGTKWEETRTIMGKQAKEIMWVTELEPNKTYVVEAESHGTKYKTIHEFSEEEGVTTVEVRFVSKPMALAAKLLSPLGILMKGTTKQMLTKDMDALKQAAEAKA